MAATKRQVEKFSSLLSEDEEMLEAKGLSGFYLQQQFVIYLLISLCLVFPLFLFLRFSRDYPIREGLIIFSIVAVVLAAIRLYILNAGVQYIFTNKRVVVKHGYFNQNIFSAAYNKITFIEVDQNFFDRVFLHHGEVIIHTSGMNAKEIKLIMVDDPLELKNLLERLIHFEKEKYGE